MENNVILARDVYVISHLGMFVGAPLWQRPGLALSRARVEWVSYWTI